MASVDPISSARSDPHLAGPQGGVARAAYDAGSGARDRRGATAYSLLAAVLLVVTIPLDHVRFPGQAHTLVLIRVGGVVALGAVLAALRGAFGERHARAIGVLAPAVVGGVQQVLASVTGGPASPIHVSTNFVILGTAVVIPWPVLWCALASGLVVGGYVAASLATPGALASPAFVDNLLALLVSTGIAAVTAVVLERRRWTLFVQAWSLERASREARAGAEALRESEARLRAVIANAPVALFTVDRAGTVTFSEGRGLERLGLSPGELVGRPLAESYPHTTDYVARAFAGEAVTWLRAIDDMTFECRLTPAHGPDGRVTRVIGVASDVTERRRGEETRLALERKLLEAQKLESLGVLAAGIAHDFNNLLVSVLGNASLALSDLPPGSPTTEQIRQIEVAARRGSDLTRQMLAYAGQGSIALERVDLNAVVDEMRGLLRVSIPRRVAERYELAAELPAVEADPTQVRQILMNLLMNAAEGIGAADGTITVRTGTAVLDDAALREMRHGPDAAPGLHVFIEVADTGCGMDAATAAKIFDPFFSTKFAGRGLGLASVLGTVRGHRGALLVRSQPGVGTTFRVFLPCRDGRPAEKAPIETAPAAVADAGRTILLVDDEEDVRMVTQHMLERLGCSVLVAGDGREGIEVFRTNAQVIDAVIVDLTLPRLGGEQAFREIRRIRPDAPVIVISGYNDERTTRRLAEAGLAGFLRKPFSVADLRTMMDRALGGACRPAAG
jgi:PAS domain S-box-containing protein